MAAIENCDIITIANVLGEANLNVVSLCTSSKINMWSKYKPVKVATLDMVTDTQRLHAYYGLVAQSVNLQYPSGANNATIFQKAKDGDFGWSYDKPTGGAQAPFRLGDF